MEEYKETNPTANASRRLALALRVLSGIGVGHFALSALAWAAGIAIVAVKRIAPVGEVLLYNVSHLVPCCLLLCLFILAFVFARRRQRIAVWALLFALGLSAALFVFDTQTAHRYQMHTFPGGVHYWTWWWYWG